MWTTISVCMSLRLFHPPAFSAASHNKPFIDCETKALSSHVVSFSHANSKSKTRIQGQDILMPKSELVWPNRDDGQCLSNEYSFMGCMWIFPEQAEQGTQEVLKRFKKNIWIFPSCNVCVYEGKGEKTAAKNYILWISSRERRGLKGSRFCKELNCQMMISELTVENCFLPFGWFESIVLTFTLYPTR